MVGAYCLLIDAHLSMTGTLMKTYGVAQNLSSLPPSSSRRASSFSKQTTLSASLYLTLAL